MTPLYGDDEQQAYARDRLTASYENLVRPVFISQLWCIALPRFLVGSSVSACPATTPERAEKPRRPTYKLDCDLLVVQQVGALEQHAEGALANLLSDAIVHAHDVGRRRGHGSGVVQRSLERGLHGAVRDEEGDNRSRTTTNGCVRAGCGWTIACRKDGGRCASARSWRLRESRSLR